MKNYSKYLTDFNTGETLENMSFYINQIENKFNLKLPTDYIEFMKEFNGGEGFIGESYLILYPLNEIIETNESYEVSKYLPNVLLIGSNGGDEALAIDFQKTKKYVIVPFLFDEEAIIEQSDTMEGFLLRTLNGEWFKS